MLTNEILKIIKQRRSARSFCDRPVTDEMLQAIVDAGMSAPYAGEGGKHFAVIQSRELLDTINTMAKEGARVSGVEHLQALGNDENFNCLYGAPVLIIISANEQAIVPEIDCAAANQNMLLAAESFGLGACWIYFALLAFGSPQGTELMKELKIPAGYKPCVSAVCGYRKDAANTTAERTDTVNFVK